jgi:hypothetical protein
MAFDRLSKGQQLQVALDLNRISAEQGKDSFFSGWWFLDTNCISELAKMWGQGLCDQVHRLLANKDILFASSVAQELRRAPDILEALDLVLEGSNSFLVPDMTRFWYTDILNFLNVDRIPMNSLETYPVPPGFFELLTQKAEFDEACTKAEADVQNRFFDVIEQDVGSEFDERDLCIYIYSVVNRYGNEWFGIDIPPADCTCLNFPSFYAFYYAYYFRYMKHQVKPEVNDLIDLTNCLPLPYCERFYGEKRFTSILRQYVQGRRPPTAYQLLKRLYRKGMITRSVYREKRQRKHVFDRTAPLLPDVEIFSLAEMREHIQAAAS